MAGHRQAARASTTDGRRTVTPAVAERVVAHDLPRCIRPDVICSLLSPASWLPAEQTKRFQPTMRAWVAERRALTVCAGG